MGIETPPTPTATSGKRSDGGRETQPEDKQRVGVADYFAIVGVGDQLVWKHAQKANDDNVIAEEDDARLLERFYREIVDCSIVVVDDIDHHHPPSAASIYSGHSQQHTSGYPSTLSPAPSDLNSTIGTEVDAIAVEGWTVLQETRPAATAEEGLWPKRQVWDANLDPLHGISDEIRSMQQELRKQKEGKSGKTPLKDLRQKVQSTFSTRAMIPTLKKKFYLAHRHRAPDEPDRPAVSDLSIHFVRIHKATIPNDAHRNTGLGQPHSLDRDFSNVGSSVSLKGAAAIRRVAEAGKHTFQSRVLGSPKRGSDQDLFRNDSVISPENQGSVVALDTLLDLPAGYDEWSIPDQFKELRFSPQCPDSVKTVLFPDDAATKSVASNDAIEARAPLSEEDWQRRIHPQLVQSKDPEEDDLDVVYVPILAIRRQRVGEDERFHEDPAIVELAVSIFDSYGSPVLPMEEFDFDEENDDDIGLTLLRKTDWSSLAVGTDANKSKRRRMGSTCLLIRRNIPLGFCDAAFSTKVLDRFPHKNYKGLPLPEEELPMFCYPTGCRLHRAKLCQAPLPQYYGFVVKNERGDSIYVSCVSFMEPLTTHKKSQLARLSAKRSRVFLAHSVFWKKQAQKLQASYDHDVLPSEEERDAFNGNYLLPDERDPILIPFDGMTTFENKTICLVSRHPYWTAFRRFLSHLHNISGSPCDIPLERHISHLLLAVPVPQPGKQSILVPLPSFQVPMMLWAPPNKDLPLLDLPFERLVACLDIPTIVTIVLGFLALERKVIVMSTRPSLVLDVCELLRSLLFPFDLCAPYVPRLTEPFMSCLDFPGAIFVGIHDDEDPYGLAAAVRKTMPEDSTIVDLDAGSVDCSGDRVQVINTSWGVLPPGPRSMLVSEIETLCRDAGIVPGQEPLDSQIDPAFEATMPNTPVEDDGTLATEKEPLDDRAFRDAFLRFFCSILGGYEQFLVVPDVDFLISGNEWFDAKGFLASASEEKASFLGSLVTTQLFQAFIQRRTEASDVHCLLFDECLLEYHSSPVPYGRLGGDVETISSKDSSAPQQLMFSLLVDQSATELHSAVAFEKNFDNDSKHDSEADLSGKAQGTVSESISRYASVALNRTGDIVTAPTKQKLPNHVRFIYCVDGNPTFPDQLNPSNYLPRHPESWLVEVSSKRTPMLTRSDKEVEEAERRRKLATSYRGLHNQRRCLWQLPKLMGSHFLGAWLLCVPALVSQESISHDQQTKYLLRALGALRILRGKHKIVPDEAAYRALIVACGRTRSDRRMELVKLFGMLRSESIFPSAVTLGQYTKALAEGYSKQGNIGAMEEDGTPDGVDSNLKSQGGTRLSPKCSDTETMLSTLEGNIPVLEEAGRRWRTKNSERDDSTKIQSLKSSSAEENVGQTDESKKRGGNKQWLPVVVSSSIAPSRHENSRTEHTHQIEVNIVPIWSRTKSCDSCNYVPLDEEVQAGWDVPGGDSEIPGAVNCPRCGSLMIPMLGYRELSLKQALLDDNGNSPDVAGAPAGPDQIADYRLLPPQVSPLVNDTDAQYVTYVSPATLRSSLERLIQENGEEILERDRLKEADPEVFFNLFWYCARFSVPLPLPVKSDTVHNFAMCAWESKIALRASQSCAKVLQEAFSKDSSQVDNGDKTDVTENSGMYGEMPLLARFNLQDYYSNVWDHEDMSEVLVTLVAACDKRDFKPVVECLLQCNKRRRERYGKEASAATSSEINGSGYCLAAVRSSDTDCSSLYAYELDCYRTALYLAKYQCTSAFHAFFPATMKPCKGYHYWCPTAPVPIFDRLLREAAKRIKARENEFAPFYDVSDVALGFRSVFGHLM